MLAGDNDVGSVGGRKYELSHFVKFVKNDKFKNDVFKGDHFNVVVVCLDDGYEIAPHYEPYDVFFYVVSGRGIFTASKSRWDAVPGSMFFIPVGVRGIKCVERLIVIGVQQPH